MFIGHSGCNNRVFSICRATHADLSSVHTHVSRGVPCRKASQAFDCKLITDHPPGVGQTSPPRCRAPQGCPPDADPQGWADPPDADPPRLGRTPPPRYGQQAGGTHPTGMHTCWTWSFLEHRKTGSGVEMEDLTKGVPKELSARLMQPGIVDKKSRLQYRIQIHLDTDFFSN